jgi:hypothetical protein
VIDGMDLPALAAGLEPSAVAEFASSVQTLVSERINHFKVFDAIVELVPVLVMDLHPDRDRAVDSLPNKNVFHSATLLIRASDPPITLGGD